ncbi:MAG: response regulator [Bdellovibrionia bacterium]
MTLDKKISVLIVDKDQAIRELIKETVSSIQMKFLMIEASDGQQGAFKADRQKFDLVICAERLPKKDGLELLRVLSTFESSKRPLRFILLAESPEDPSWRQIFSPFSYLKKPFDTALLKQTIEAALKS